MTAPNSRERILPRLIDEEIKESFINYSMSVIVSRALPDVRDGLKPVQRRVLFAMNELGLVPTRAYKKSATVVGDVLGKYHPHGDSSVYDALVRMVQDFSLRYPLVDGQGNFGCFTGDTKLKLLDGTERTFAELAELPPGQLFHVYAVDAAGRIVVGEGHSSRVTRRAAPLVEVTFDDGSRVRCTPDHRFMLRDGTWKAAQHLTVDDSLMAGHFDTAPVNARTGDYLRVRQPATGEWEFVHRIADAFNAERGRARPVGTAFVRHHQNFDRFDNRPDNIVRMLWLEHAHLHADRLRELWQDDAFRAAQRDGVRAYHAAHPEVADANRERLAAQNRDVAFRAANGPRVAAALRRRHAAHPEFAAARAAHLRRLWQLPEYRAKMSRALRGIEKRPLTAEQRARVARIVAEHSRALWSDPARRAAMSAAIVHALSDPHVRERISDTSRRLWLDPAYRAKFAPDHHRRMAAALWADPATREAHRAKIARQWQDPAFRAAHRDGRRTEWERRRAVNPSVMHELAARSAVVLTARWSEASYRRRVMRTKIAGYAARLLAEVGREQLTPTVYDARRHANWVPASDKALAYFDSFEELVRTAATHNHRAVAVRWLDDVADVYDVTVNEHHNFMLANGCVVHNSVDGDPAAAYRYTEARLTRAATELLSDYEKNTVDFAPNYDDRLTEPTVLPSGLPNLMVNGSSGIAVGMATNIPPHNLREVVGALHALIDDPEAPGDVLRKHIKGPDFPTGAYIYGKQGIADYITTGRGRIVMRARAVIEEKESSSKSQIVVTELPYQVNKARLVEQIAELHRDQKVEGISALRDESDRDGMRIVIELKRDAIPRVVLNQIYKHSTMQSTFGVIMLALVPDPTTRRLVPKVMPVRDVLQHFVTHRHEVIVRRTQFELDKALEREHILEGLKIAVDNIDAVIKIIRAAADTPTASGQLQRRFKLSERQAEAILNLRLAKLTGLEIEKLEEELGEVRATIADLRGILESRPRRMQIMKSELAEIAGRYGDERRSEIIADEGEFSIEDLIAEEDMVVTISHSGYIKRTPVTTYRKQRRGGRGLSGQALKDTDFIQRLFIASTHDYIMIFTDDGRCYWLKVHEIPVGGRDTRGKPIVNLINVGPDTKIRSMVAVREFREDQYLFFCTRDGTVKKTPLSDYGNVRATGIKAIKIEDGDALIDVQVTSGTNDVVLATRHGLSVRFPEADVRPMGRDTTGVKGVTLRPEDKVVSMIVVRRADATMLVVTSKGMGKVTDLGEYRVQGRGGKGILTLNRTDKTGNVVAVMEVVPDEEIMLITKNGVVIRSPVNQVRNTGRNAQGVKLVNLDSQDELCAVATVVSEKEEDGDATPAPDGGLLLPDGEPDGSDAAVDDLG